MLFDVAVVIWTLCGCHDEHTVVNGGGDDDGTEENDVVVSQGSMWVRHDEDGGKRCNVAASLLLPVSLRIVLSHCGMAALCSCFSVP